MPTSTRRPPPTAAHPPPVLHRVREALAGRFPHKATRQQPTPEEQLTALLGILDEAVAAQPRAEGAIAACGEPGPVPGSVARQAGAQISVYHRLMVRLRALPVGGECAELTDPADPAELGERASRLLAYHEWLLHEAVSLTFTAAGRDPRVEAARLRLTGLGAPAGMLRALRDEVRERAADSGAGAAR